jgi:hypothetical protein
MRPGTGSELMSTQVPETEWDRFARQQPGFTHFHSSRNACVDPRINLWFRCALSPRSRSNREVRGEKLLAVDAVERGGRGEKPKGTAMNRVTGAGHRLKLFTAITAHHRGRREVQWRRLNCPDA